MRLFPKLFAKSPPPLSPQMIKLFLLRADLNEGQEYVFYDPFKGVEFTQSVEAVPSKLSTLARESGAWAPNFVLDNAFLYLFVCRVDTVDAFLAEIKRLPEVKSATATVPTDQELQRYFHVLTIQGDIGEFVVADLKRSITSIYGVKQPTTSPIPKRFVPWTKKRSD